jgi:aspartate/tyrosine/aromatic aminotransferase
MLLVVVLYTPQAVHKVYSPSSKHSNGYVLLAFIANGMFSYLYNLTDRTRFFEEHFKVYYKTLDRLNICK